MIFILSLFAFKTKVTNFGVTQLSLTEESSVEVILDQPNTSSYLFFSDIPPNFTYVSVNEDKIYLNDTYMFISDQDIDLHITKPTSISINLTIWIIPSDICSINARIFKTNQIIFSHWVFASKLKQLCFFPINNAEAKADITIISPRRLEVKSNVIIYSSYANNSLDIYSNLTKSKLIGPYGMPFFIALNNAGPGTVFSYDLHFTETIEDICIDEPFKFLDKSSKGFISTFSAQDEHNFVCSNESFNKTIGIIFCSLLIIFAIILIVVVILLVKRFCCLSSNKYKSIK